jgi:hypothetical protein
MRVGGAVHAPESAAAVCACNKKNTPSSGVGRWSTRVPCTLAEWLPPAVAMATPTRSAATLAAEGGSEAGGWSGDPHFRFCNPMIANITLLLSFTDNFLHLLLSFSGGSAQLVILSNYEYCGHG